MGSPVHAYVPTPQGFVRQLSSTPEPYTHPRILFSEADRDELTQRAQGSSKVGPTSFAALSAWVDEVVYGTSSPVKRLFDVMENTVMEGKLTGSPQAAFDSLCELVTDPADPEKVLRSPFYADLFQANLAPASLAMTLSSARLFAPPATDTTPQLGVQYLFASVQGGVPYFLSPIYDALHRAGYVAWINKDSARLQYLATILAVATGVHLLWYPSPPGVLTKLVGGHGAQYDQPDMSVSHELALAYDWLYAGATDEQRLPARRLLLRMSLNRVPSGFDAQGYRTGTAPGLSHLFTSGTFQVMTSLLLLAHYAVEGESVDALVAPDGSEVEPALRYDDVAADLSAKMLTFYLSHGTAWDPTGSTREAPGYFMTAMKPASFPALAAARRGYDLFGSTNFYPALMDVFQTLSPWSSPPLCFGAHDGISFCGGPGQSEYYLLVKYMFPEDPLTDFVYQKYNTDPRGRIGMFRLSRMDLPCAILGLDPNPVPLSFADLAVSVQGLPLAFFSNCRGFGTARSNWSDEDGLLLYFECRPDVYNMGHLHSNRNDFYLAACGRLWVSVGQYHNTENEAHSTVLVDGVGQGGSRTKASPRKLAELWSHFPGRIVETFDSPRLAWFAGDASAAYRYVTDGPNNPLNRDRARFAIETPYCWKDFFLEEPDFGPQLVLDKVAKGPKWVVDNSWAAQPIYATALFNPVLYAFRTACVVRSPRAYVILVDDISKDGGEHTYTWVANTTYPYESGVGLRKPLVLADPALYGLNPKEEAVFVRGEDFDKTKGAPKPLSPCLFLRVLHAAGAERANIRLVFVPKGASGTQGTATSFDYHRIEIECRGSIDPSFKILLFPLFEGQALPTTAWNEGGDQLTVEWQGESSGVRGPQRDVLAFVKDGDRTRVQLVDCISASTGSGPGVCVSEI